MSKATDLAGVGMPIEQAVRLGFSSNNITAAGTTSADAALLPVANTAPIIAGGAGNSGIKLPSTAELLREYIFINPTANAILLYPPTSGSINGGTATTGTVTIPANSSMRVMRYSTLGWAAGSPAAISGNSGTISGTLTVGAIAGADAALDVTGIAAAQGGAITATGGTSSTAGNAGGAVGMVGGTPGSTGVGGAASVAGGAGGSASGSGGAATVAGGVGTAGNATGGVASVTGGAGQGTGNGAAASLVGGASGAGATGNGATANVTGGAAASTNGNGGAVVLTGGAKTGTGKVGAIFKRGAAVVNPQGAPAAKTVTAAISAAELVGGLITTTGVTAPSIHQLPTGTLIDAELPGIATGDSFDFSIINTGTGASDDATITVNTDVTIVGNPTIGSLTDATIISGSGRFRARRSGANTYVVYRLA